MERVIATVPEDVTLSDAFRTFQPGLVRRLALVVRDAEEAQDLVQEGFLRAAARWPPAPPESIGRWLTKVCVRIAIDEQRRRHRWGFFELGVSDAAWAIETDPDLWAALAQLDRRTRAALVLSVLEGYTQLEVAEALGVPRGTVASWLSRAREKLRPLLEVPDDERR